MDIRRVVARQIFFARAPSTIEIQSKAFEIVCATIIYRLIKHISTTSRGKVGKHSGVTYYKQIEDNSR